MLKINLLFTKNWKRIFSFYKNMFLFIIKMHLFSLGMWLLLVYLLIIEIVAFVLIVFRNVSNYEMILGENYRGNVKRVRGYCYSL